MDLDNQQAHPIDAKREELKSQALSLRITRASYRQIARVMAISVSYAHELVTEALNETRQLNEDQASELRALEVAMLDEMTVKLWPKAAAAREQAPKLDPRTADTILRISERRAKLLGLDAPTRWEGSGPGGGPFPIVGGALDLSRLSLEDLQQLEAMYARAGALAAVKPGEPLALAPPPAPSPSHTNGNGSEPHA